MAVSVGHEKVQAMASPFGSYLQRVVVGDQARLQLPNLREVGIRAARSDGSCARCCLVDIQKAIEMNAPVSDICNSEAMRGPDLLLNAKVPLLAIRGLGICIDSIERGALRSGGCCGRMHEPIREPVEVGASVSRIVEGPIIECRSVDGKARGIGHIRRGIVNPESRVGNGL